MTIKISENIKRLRKNKEVTQEQIAEMLGVSVTAVSKWERRACACGIPYAGVPNEIDLSF